MSFGAYGRADTCEASEGSLIPMSAEATAFALCRTDKRVLSSVIVRQVQDDICEIKVGGSTSGLARTAAGGAATCHAERVDATARKKRGMHV